MSHTTDEDQEDPSETTKASLDKIKKQLTSPSRCLLQGPLLKRSETLRKWNQRWFTLDPTTGKIEYRIRRGDISPKGFLNLDAGTSIVLSPVNLQGSVKYDGCCIYIVTGTKKEYFLCAETPACAKAWVSTLQAAQLVLKAHKEAVSSLGGNGSTTVGTVAAVVAAANATAKEAAKEIASALQSSALKSEVSGGNEGVMDNLTIMKETIKVKDEELHQMAKDMRAKDKTIKELAERLTDTAEAAEAAASAAHIMDKERKAVRVEIAKIQKELDEKLQVSTNEMRAMEEKLIAAEKARDEALKEARFWQTELAKARQHAVTMEAVLHEASVRAEHSARQVALAVESKNKVGVNQEIATSVKCIPESGAEHIPDVQVTGPEVTSPLSVSASAQLDLGLEASGSYKHGSNVKQDDTMFQNGVQENSVKQINIGDVCDNSPACENGVPESIAAHANNGDRQS